MAGNSKIYFILQKYERCYQFLQSLTAGLSDKDAHDALNNALIKEKGYEDVSFGLLVTILTEPQNAAKCYRDLTLITRDGFGLVLNGLSQLVLDKYLKFNDVAKSQLLWLLREMIKNAVANVDNLCWNLMRHAAGGDISPRNINLIESLLDIFVEYRSWLEKFPVLLASVVYTYLRLVEDHNGAFLANLRQKEVNFLISVLRERFFECLVIGRDLVRLLQNVARIPEFEQLWRDMLMAPRTLSPAFTGVLQLLQTRTSRRFLQSRLTPEMERKLVFLTSQVRFGQHKRYQDWFQRQYLATPESQSLRCDMIRFIVGVIHPTNELLCSDIIPRWAVIGWLLTTCTSTVAVSNAKLALFYDWLFFDSEKDNIMNIEPAILVIYHSMRSHPPVSATLLDFLCRIIANFYPPLTDKVRSGIFSSLKQILDKRVVPSLQPLFDNVKLDKELRYMIRETFKEFCVHPAMESSSKMDDFPTPEDHVNNILNNHVLDNEPAFSDEEDEPVVSINPPEEDTDDDDIPLSEVRLKEKIDKADESYIEGPVKTTLTKLQNDRDTSKRYQAMETLVSQIADLDLDTEMLPAVAKSLITILSEDFKLEIYPKEATKEALSNSIKYPVFALFKGLFDYYKQENNGKELLYKLIAEMYALQPSLGYLLLYYLTVHLQTDFKKEEISKMSAVKVSVYKEFCQNVEKKVDNALYDDLYACHLGEHDLMIWLVPDLYKDFKQQTVNNAQILRVIVSTLDSSQLQGLVCRIMQGRLSMFKSDSLQNLLKTSLSWESIEQFFLWQLIQAHNLNIDSIIPLISHLEYENHTEALTAITLMLKQETPTSDTIKYLFSRDVRECCDTLLYTMIKYWCSNNLDKIGDLVSSLLSTRYPATSPNKRKRPSNKSLSATVPSADQVLGHLEQIRVTCDKIEDLGLFSQDSMQKSLQVAHSNSSDSQRKQFSELFALVEEEETTTTKSKGPGRGRKPANKTTNKRNTRDISDLSPIDTSEVSKTLL